MTLRLRLGLFVRRCVSCRDVLRDNGMPLYQVGTLCPSCWTNIRAQRRAGLVAIEYGDRITTAARWAVQP
jgi:hypothetical protein